MARERALMRDYANNKDFSLAVREIYKNYGTFCAVRNLTFGVRKTDCFGLLGKFFLQTNILKYSYFLNTSYK